MEKISKQIQGLKEKLKKAKADINIWKYAYRNKVTEFFNVAESVRKDFFKDDKEVRNFLRIVKIELNKGKINS